MNLENGICATILLYRKCRNTCFNVTLDRFITKPNFSKLIKYLANSYCKNYFLRKRPNWRNKYLLNNCVFHFDFPIFILPLG